MRVVWLIVFLVLLLGQVIAWFTGRIPDPRTEPVNSVSSAELTELAESICEFWGSVSTDPVRTREEKFIEFGTESVLEREQMMLLLRDEQLNPALSKAAGKIRICDQLEAWIKASRGKAGPEKNIRTMLPYLAGLLDWLKSCSATRDGAVLERSFLAPEPGSDYPALVFELTGIPADLRSFLQDFESRNSGWRLQELDLNRNPAGWWLHGSFTYGGDGL